MKLENLQDAAWHSGRLLAFSGLDGATDFSNCLVGRTCTDSPGIAIKIPGKCRIEFGGELAQVILFSGDFFAVKTSQGVVRGAFIDCYHLLIEGPCRICQCDAAIRYQRHDQMTLIGATAAFNDLLLNTDFNAAFEARQQWLLEQKIFGRVAPTSLKPCYRALCQMKTQVYTPEGPIAHRWTTPERWPHRSIWLWDTVFHAIGWRHIDGGLAQEMLAAVFDNQREDGFVPHQMDPRKVSGITQPPVLALGVKMVYEMAPNLEWVRSLYPKLGAYLEWDFRNRDTDGSGLCEWWIEDSPTCRSGESGMDNSPRFDGATQLDAVDFNSFLALECEIMASFATMLEIPGDAVKWRERQQRLCKLINERLWSEEQGLYFDYDIKAGRRSDIMAVSGFMPLLCKAANAAQVERLIQHLENPKTFGTPFPVPSIAACDKVHYQKDMWRGPTWVNTNWLIIYGLERYGLTGPADRLRERTVAVIEAMVHSYGTFFEFYDDRLQVPPPQLLRKGECAPQKSPLHQVVHDLGWTATLYIDLIMAQSR